jgi:phosphatidylserine/phosphatidylglycerophosphate/cardiolipin synthase-like enzyme
MQHLTPQQPPPPLLAPSFARGLWRIAGADVSGGNDVQLLHDGEMTFDAMIADIAAAQQSVRLEGYIFRADEVGQRFRDALCAAAARGVQVRVLVDWIGKWPTPRRFFNEMRRGGVDVRMFNPPGFRAWLGLVPRDHRKLLVVDDASGITGGIGIGNEWRTGVLRRRGAPWRDTAVRVAGPGATDMAESFDRMWTRTDGKERRSSDRYLARRRRDRAVGGAMASGERSLVGVVQGEPFRLRVARALQIQAVSAERSIWIASAYFIPAYAEIEALVGAARDGVDVRILVPHRYDHFWIRLLTRRVYRRLLVNGVRIWEWSGEMMHAKTSVVDDRWVRVGSTDFNPLGIAINYELDVLIDDPIIGAEAAMVFLDDLEESKEITMPKLGQLSS